MARYNLIVIVLLLVLAACNGNNPEQGRVADAMSKSAKRGVAFNFQNLEDLPLLSPYISWDYNWGNTPSDNAALWFDTNEMDYCPMCWNGSYNADKIREYVKAHPSTKYLLAFNEPNLTDQARMTPKEAAAIWPHVVALAKELNLKLVSPAMNYGTLSGYSNPITWLDEFLTQPEVSSSDIYAISIHCYMASAGGLKGFVEMFEKYDKPIWLTEFCAWDPVPGSIEVQMNYMCNALNYLEQHASVERYAWFIPRTNKPVDSAPYMQLLTHDDTPELTDLGKMYTRFSTFDKSVALNAERFIHAGEYMATSENSLQVRPSTDTYATAHAGREGLMVSNLPIGLSVTYQIYVPWSSENNVISLRYCGYSNSICELQLDNQSPVYVDMPRNGSTTEWIVAHTPVMRISQGMHTLTIKLQSGSCYISGFEVNGVDD
ncbi:MAG: glycoside hydrolase family protein [Paludibacteraceae bacterium]|nr:glycoside hydrolase family protein [Paludibacteraceae bacterium]